MEFRISQYAMLLGLPPLTIHCKYLKLVTMYNIISGNMYFPSGHFVYYTSPYYTRNCNFIRPFSRLNYMYHSFVPSVISLWNNLQPHQIWSYGPLKSTIFHGFGSRR